MRIFWIGKKPTTGQAGDEVFDRQTIAACRAQGHIVDLFHPVRVGRPRELANLISGLPHHRARFACEANVSAIREHSRSYDAVVCSWEPFDALVRQAAPPAILILHNVTSRALPEMFPDSLVAAQGARQARRWERTHYRAERFAAIGALSRRDLDYVQNLRGGSELILLPPGMPPCTPLAANAPLLRELVISGTYDWIPKRRDALAFAREYMATVERVTVRADGLPPEAMQRLRPAALPSRDENTAAIRFGVITDRFEAGHKLKTLAYLAANQIVLSFCDVSFDFLDVADHPFFIRRVTTAADIATQIDDITTLPATELRARFAAFQSNCARRFTWQAVASSLLETAGTISTKQRQPVTGMT